MSDEFQLHIDFLTGKPTAIVGPPVSDRIRASCHALNLGRKSGIEAAIGVTPPRRTVSIDVWTDRFTDRLAEQRIPLIDLEGLGFRHDEGFLTNDLLRTLPSGAEASPFLDEENGVVYKLFDLRPGGTMGKKLRFQSRSQGFEIEISDARWSDMLDKFIVLNHGGGYPTGTLDTELVSSSDPTCQRGEFVEMSDFRTI